MSGATPLLELPEVALIVAWTSLPLLELRLKELVIDRPRLAIRRDRAGILHVAGIEIDPAQTTDDLPLTDWILRQREIVIRDALITWDDDQRNAPQLVLDRVQFRLENRFGRASLRSEGHAACRARVATRPARRFHRDVDDATGRRRRVACSYVSTTPTSRRGASGCRCPAQIASGKGALRVWFQFAQGEAREIVADLELAEVKARLADGLPELDLAASIGTCGLAQYGSPEGVLHARSGVCDDERRTPRAGEFLARRGATERASARRRASSNSTGCNSSHS